MRFYSFLLVLRIVAVEFDFFQNIEDINYCKLIMNELCELGNLNMLKDYKCILKSATTYHLMELQCYAMIWSHLIRVLNQIFVAICLLMESLYNLFVRTDRLHMYCIALYCIVLYCIVLYCIVLYCIVLYCIVLYCTVLYCIVLYCIVMCCIVLYCVVLYNIILYYFLLFMSLDIHLIDY